MPQEDAELLRLVREWRPSATLHPMAMQAWHIYEDAGLTVSDDVLEKIKAALDDYAGNLASLGQALEGLVRFSILLSDNQNDASGAEKIVALMTEYTPRFEPFFERVAEAIGNVGGAVPMRQNEPAKASKNEHESHANPIS